MSLAAAALAYAEMGWPVFPLHSPMVRSDGGLVCSCRKNCGNDLGKHPRTRHGFQDASTDRHQIARWWRAAPAANIGTPTGAVTGVTVLDIDPRYGGDVSLADLERKYGPLPPTARNRSGSGGEHIFFQYIAGVRDSVALVGPGIDVRGDGGYIIVPPSLHKSGNRYEITCNLPPAPAPPWLVTLMVPTGGRRAAAPPEYWRELFAAGAVEGARVTTLIKMAGYLLRRGLDPLLVLDIVKIWNRDRFEPPLDEAKVTKDLNGLCRTILRKGARRGR